MKYTRQLRIFTLEILGISVLIGTAIAAFSPGELLPGFWRSTLFSLFLMVIMAAAVWFLEPGRIVVVIAAAAFLVRLAVGIGLYLALPDYGYDTDVQNAGYLYSDAFVRDQGSYARAFPERIENADVSELYIADQYGGLSVISTSVYRLFSTDVHRPLLMILFSAFTFALAVLFTWKAIGLEWGSTVALIGIIVMAAYPEGIILASSQMREPVLIALAAISFWATVSIQTGHAEVRRLPLVWSCYAYGMLGLSPSWVGDPDG